MIDVVITGAKAVPASSEACSGSIAPEDGASRSTGKPARRQRMDRLCALALLAADGALNDAGLGATARAHAWHGDRVAIVVGTAFGCHAANEEYFRTYLEGGARAASPRLFAYTLPSSPAGELSIHYAVRGPTETLPSGSHAGIEALGRAARLCARAAADLAIVVAVDTPSETLRRIGHLVDGGAAALIVERRAHASLRGATPRAEILDVQLGFGAAPAPHPRDIQPEVDAPLVEDAVTPLRTFIAWLDRPSDAPARLVARDPNGAFATVLAQHTAAR